MNGIICFKRHNIAFLLLFFLILSLFSPRVIICHEIIKGEVGFELESYSCCARPPISVSSFFTIKSSGLNSVGQGFADECKDSELITAAVRGREPAVKPCNLQAGVFNFDVPCALTHYCKVVKKDLQRVTFTIPVFEFLSTTVLLN